MSMSTIRFREEKEEKIDNGSEGVVGSAAEDIDLCDQETKNVPEPSPLVHESTCNKCGRIGDHLTIDCQYGIGKLASKYARNTIRFRNLAEDTDKSDLECLCRTYGPVAFVLEPGMRRGKRNQGLVAMENNEDAQNAIEKLNGYTFNNRVLTVEWATNVPEETKNVPDPSILAQENECKSCGKIGDHLTKDCRYIKGKMIKKKYDQNTILVRNLAEDTDKSDLKWLCRTYGPVHSVFEPGMHHEGMRDLALVAFENKEDARTAIEKLNGSTFNNRVLTVEWSKSVPDRSPAQEEKRCRSCGEIGGHLTKDCQHAIKGRLVSKYVENTIRVPADTDRLDLIELCSNYGPVERVFEKKDYIAVAFENKEDALMAIEKLNGSTLNHRVLEVELWAEWAVKEFPRNES